MRPTSMISLGVEQFHSRATKARQGDTRRQVLQVFSNGAAPYLPLASGSKGSERRLSAFARKGGRQGTSAGG